MLETHRKELIDVCVCVSNQEARESDLGDVVIGKEQVRCKAQVDVAPVVTCAVNLPEDFVGTCLSHIRQRHKDEPNAVGGEIPPGL